MAAYVSRDVVVTTSADFPRKSDHQPFSSQGALSSRRLNPPLKPKTPPSITSWAVVRSPPPAGLEPLAGVPSRLGERKRPDKSQKVRPLAGHDNQSHARSSAAHQSEKMLAAVSMPSDVSMGSGVIGRNVPNAPGAMASLSQHGSKGPTNPCLLYTSPSPRDS